MNQIGKKFFIFCLSFVFFFSLSGCEKGHGKLIIMGNEVEITEDNSPLDYATDDSDFLEISGVFGRIKNRTNDTSDGFLEGDTLLNFKLESDAIEMNRSELNSIKAGSLQKLISTLYQLSIEQKKRNEYLISCVIEAYWKHYESALSEELSLYNQKISDYVAKLSEKSDSVSCLTIAGTLIGGFLTGGPGGMAVGALSARYIGKKSNVIPYPDLPSYSQMERRSSLKAGLGNIPEMGIEELSARMNARFLGVDIATSETALSAYEILLRRVVFNVEDSFRLAEVASNAYKKASIHFATAQTIWNENSNHYQYARAIYEKAARQYERCTDALLVSLVVTAFIQTSVDYSGMRTSEYRRICTQKGINMKGMDADHIIPKNLGGVDHPWNYQPLRSALNRSWKDGHLFEKCLRNPIGFVKGTIVSAPGHVGNAIGYSFLQHKKSILKALNEIENTNEYLSFSYEDNNIMHLCTQFLKEQKNRSGRKIATKIGDDYGYKYDFTKQGLLIKSIKEESPYFEFFKPGDVLIAINDERYKKGKLTPARKELLGGMKPQLKLTILRGNDKVYFRLVRDEFIKIDNEKDDGYKFGFIEGGLVIKEVERKSPYFGYLKENDVIVSVNGKKYKSGMLTPARRKLVDGVSEKVEIGVLRDKLVIPYTLIM